MRDGLMRYERGKPWRGPAAKIELGEGWQAGWQGAPCPWAMPNWEKAVVLSKNGDTSQLGFTDGSTGTCPACGASARCAARRRSAAQALRPGDVIPVVKQRRLLPLRQAPEISGGMVVEDAHTGRVLAMVGGFDARAQSFNRATQAKRQPGSTFKPIVYATAMDNGFTPSSIVVDAPYCVYQTRSLGQKCFKNFGNMRGAGAQTLRWGLEQSRNLMTVRIAYQHRHGQGGGAGQGAGHRRLSARCSPIALGAGETTVLKLTNAYAQIFNAGRAAGAVADRHGAGPQWQGDLAARQPQLPGLRTAPIGTARRCRAPAARRSR